MNNEDPNKSTTPEEPVENNDMTPENTVMPPTSEPAMPSTDDTESSLDGAMPTPPATDMPSAASDMPVAPVAPPVAGDQPQAPTQPAGPVQATVTEHHTDGLGIASIILAFVGLQLIGFILGLVGASQAKKQGRSATLSRVGWILNLIFGLIFTAFFLFVVLAGFQVGQKDTRDLERRSDVNAIHAKLEEYRNLNGYYPAQVSESTLSGIDSKALTDPQGGSYTYTPSPAGCTKCASYKISAKMESTTGMYSGTYTKESLEDTVEDLTPSSTVPTSKL